MMVQGLSWRRALGWLLALAILFFLVRTLWTTWDQVAQSGFTFQFNLLLLLASVVLLVPGRSFAVEAWRRILGTLGHSISFRFAFYAWFVSNLARFIPGNVWQLAAMMCLTQDAGVSKLNILLSQAVYAAIALSVAALYGLTLLPIATQYLPLAALVFLALIAFLAMPPVLRAMLHVSTRVLKLLPRNAEMVAPRVTITFWQGLAPPLCSFTMWTINGIAFWLFTRSLVEISLEALPSFIAINAAAYFIGYASLVTPSGLGFREATLALLLQSYFPAPIAVGIAFLARLWSLAGEFLGVGLALWGKPRQETGGLRITDRPVAPFLRFPVALLHPRGLWRREDKSKTAVGGDVPTRILPIVGTVRRPAPTGIGASGRPSHYFALAVVGLLILTYSIYFSALSIQRHRAFLTNASDLGQIDQAIWNTLQGRLLEFTRRTGEQSVRLTDHVEPIFIPASLVFLLYDNVEALLILQSFMIGLGALPVFWIARRRLGAVNVSTLERSNVITSCNRTVDWRIEIAALAFAAMYLLFPSLEAANLAEFHAVTFAPAFLLFMYHYGSLKQWGHFTLFSLLALMVKEEIALLVFTMAAYFSVFEFKRFTPSLSRPLSPALASRLLPPALALLALAWFTLAVFVIIPQFNTLGRSPYTCRYIVSEDCPEIAHGLFLEQRLGYLLQLLASSGFISLLDPVSLLLGSPLILANVISNYPAQYSGTFHYSAPLVPYFILAAIGGSAHTIRRLNQRGYFTSSLHHPLNLTPISLIIAVFFFACAYHLFAGYTPLARNYAWPTITKHHLLFERFAAQIPRTAKVATTTSLHPHLSHRQYLYRYPVVNDAEYVLLDVTDSDRGIPIEFRVRYNELLERDAYGVVDAADGYVLLKRGAPHKNLPDEFFTLFRAERVAPQYPARIEFGGKVRLLGYAIQTDRYGRGSLVTYWQRLKPLEQNYYLFPFFTDESGKPIENLNFPMTILFWYPTSAWKKDEVVVARTIPLEWGARIRIGLGVLEGAEWSNRETRLPVKPLAPGQWRLFDDDTWVELGTFVQEGNEYRRMVERYN